MTSDARVHPPPFVATAAPLIVMALSIVAAVLIAGYLAVERYERSRDARTEEVAGEASSSARQLEQFFNERFETLDAIATAPVVQEGDPAAVKAYFERLVAEGSSFSGGLSVIGTDGIMVLLSGFPLNEPPIDLSDRDYVQAVLNTDAPAFGNAIVGRRSGDPLLTFAVPIRDDSGTTTGILAGTIRLDIPEAGLGRLALPLDEVIVIDGANNLVMDRGLVDTIAPASPELLRGIGQVDGASSVVDLPLDGASSVAGVAPLGETPWRVLVVKREGALLAPARRELTWQLSLLGVLAVAAVLALAGFAWQRRTDLRARAQSQRLAESEARLRATLEITPVTLSSCDADRRYTWAFHPDGHHTDEADLLGKTDEELWPPESVQELVDLKKDALESNEPVRRVVTVERDGAARQFDVYAQRTGAPGEHGLLVAALDVTEAAEREEALREALHAKDEFLGLVSHELRTPITIITGNMRVLASRMGQLDQKSLETAVHDVASASARLARIIEDLLILARPEAGVSLEIAPLPVSQLLAQVLRDHQHDAPARKIVQEDGGGALYLMADEGCVRQVLENLLSNADKYSPAGASIEVSAEARGDDVVLSVADRGIGLRGDVTRIFEPFYREAGAMDTASGIGVGLAVCKRLTEAMDGRIWAESRPGGGSIFRVALPNADLAALIDEDDPEPNLVPA